MANPTETDTHESMTTIGNFLAEALAILESHAYLLVVFRNDHEPLFSGACAEDIDMATAIEFAHMFGLAESAAGRDPAGADTLLDAANIKPPNDIKH